MSTKKDNSLILNKIKSHYNFTTDTQFAKFLGIAKTTLASWHTRGSFDYDLVYAKCESISGDWLLSGEGSMIRPKEMDNMDTPFTIEGLKDEIREMMSESILVQERISNRDQTISDLRKTISAQEKTISAQEKLLDPKSSRKTATNVSGSARPAPGQLKPEEEAHTHK